MGSAESLSRGDKGMVGLQALAAAVPWCGGALATIIFEPLHVKRHRRVESLVAELRVMLDAVDQAKIDHDFLASEEFSDIVEEVVGRYVRTGVAIKLAAYRTVLVGSMQVERPPTEEVELFLARLPFLVESHFEVLRCFRDAGNRPVTYEELNAHLGACGSSVIDLTNLGLLYKPSLAIFGSDEPIPAPEPLPTEEFTLTPFGGRFVGFVIADGGGPAHPTTGAREG